MRRLDLYRDGDAPLTALEAEAQPLSLDPACTRCALGDGLRSQAGHHTVCVPDEGDPGGLMLIGEAPGRDEDRAGRPFYGRTGRYLREIVGKLWKGPVAYANALRCFPGSGGPKDKHINQCRPYLSQTLLDAAPKRIVTLGAWAAMSVLGRKVAPFSTRKGYAYVQGKKIGGQPVPVFMCIHPAAALRNRFIRAWFEEDFRWALTTNTLERPPWDAQVNIVETEEDARLAVQELAAENDWVTVDVETAGRMFTPAFEIISVAVCGNVSDDAWVWPMDAINSPEMLAHLKRVLTLKSLPKLGQNFKYDELAIFSAFDIRVDPVIGDTRLWRKLMEPEANGKLSAMVELVGMGGMKEDFHDEQSERLKKVRKAINKGNYDELDLPPAIESALRLGVRIEDVKFALVKPDVLSVYNARDSVGTKRLALQLLENLNGEPHLKRTWNTIVQPASKALVQVEGWGIAADVGMIKQFDAYLEQKQRVAKSVLDSYDPNVNWDSAPQVRSFLFGKLKLPSHHETDSGQASTDAEALEHLASLHPAPRALVDYRTITKLRGTYAQGLYEYVCADGRIHPNIKLDGARSGRTSCTDPNLQNIPRADRSIETKMARDCFVAPSGFSLVELDYSQLELRVAAMLSGDKEMINIFHSGVDYHQRTAEMISKIAWGIEAAQVTKEHRVKAKAVNFGIIYGKTARTLAGEWGVSVADAQRIYDAIMGKFRQLSKWSAERVREARNTGCVWTAWDGQPARRRPLYRVADNDDLERSRAEHGAVNSPIQGTASDYCIASLAAVVEWILGDGVPDTKLVLPVHDSLLLEVRNDMVDEVAHQVRDIMSSWPATVPLVVDCKTGPSWGSMKDYKFAA